MLWPQAAPRSTASIAAATPAATSAPAPSLALEQMTFTATTGLISIRVIVPCLTNARSVPSSSCVAAHDLVFFVADRYVAPLWMR